MPAALTPNSPGITRGKGIKRSPHPWGVHVNWKSIPPGLVINGVSIYPGRNPGYWKVTPLVSFFIIVKAFSRRSSCQKALLPPWGAGGWKSAKNKNYILLLI